MKGAHCIRALFASSETEIAMMFNVTHPAITERQTCGVRNEVDRVLDLKRYLHLKVESPASRKTLRRHGSYDV